jgi:N-methylhydantoinase B
MAPVRGFGAVREFEMRADDAFTYASMGRSVERPWGLDGGGPGSTNYLEIASDGARQRIARIARRDLQPGDRVTVVTGGGGGFGDPLARPPEEVAEDVRNDYLSAAAARDDYGVVVGEDGALDQAATDALRRERS